MKKGGNAMRITAQMLNAQAMKAGMPIKHSTLLDYVKKDKMNSPLYEALNNNKRATVNSVKKGSYEKLDKVADKLNKSAKVLQGNDEKDIFEQAKISGDGSKVYESIEMFVDDYNDMITALKTSPNTINEFYRQMLSETSDEIKGSLKNIGVTFNDDGTADVDIAKIKKTDLETLEGLFGKESDFVSKVDFISGRISDNAEANIKSLSSTYNSGGNTYEASGKNRYDFFG